MARVAGLQRGFIVREQLLAAGLGRGAIAHRVKSHRLHLYHRGVYLVGHTAMDPLGEEMAAILNYRGHAVLSHRSAATVWELVPRAPSQDVMVTLVGKEGRSRPGLRVFRVRSLDRRDIRTRNRLPVTSPARTLLDLAAVLRDDHELEQAIGEAQARELTTASDIEAALARAPGRKGTARIERLLDPDHGYTRSRAERIMRAIVREAGLLRPLTNVPLLGYVADFLWPAERLVVEVDGHASHSSRAAFEHDRRRDQCLLAAGYRVMRVTWRQLLHDPLAVIARLAQALARAA